MDSNAKKYKCRRQKDKKEPKKEPEKISEKELKKETKKEPVKWCERHTYCDKVGIGRGRALDLNKDGICDTCGGKISNKDYQVIIWPDPYRRVCPGY